MASAWKYLTLLAAFAEVAASSAVLQLPLDRDTNATSCPAPAKVAASDLPRPPPAPTTTHSGCVIYPIPTGELVAAYSRGVSRARRSIAQYQFQSQSMSWRSTNSAVWHSRSRLVTDAAENASDCLRLLERGSEGNRVPRWRVSSARRFARRSTKTTPVEHSPERAQRAWRRCAMEGSRRRSAQ